MNTDVVRHPFGSAGYCEACLRRAGWWWLAGLAITVGIWAIAGDWRVSVRSWALTGLATTIVAMPLLIRRYRRDARLARSLIAVIQMLVFFKLAAMLSYFTVATNAPLVDAALARWDAVLGFDWAGMVRWVRADASIARAFDLGYQSGLLQLPLVVLILGFFGPRGHLEEYLQITFAATLITVLLSGLWPAAGPFKYFAGLARPDDLAILNHFEPLRSGAMRTVFYEPTQGIVSIPSLHTAMGVIFVYAVRSIVWAVWPLGGLNVLMIVATPPVGGHYLVDVIAGALLAGVTIVAARRWLPRHRGEPHATASAHSSTVVAMTTASQQSQAAR